MKKLLIAASVAMSFGAIAADPVTHTTTNTAYTQSTATELRDNLRNIYGDIKDNSWGATGSDAGAHALANFVQWIDGRVTQATDTTNPLIGFSFDATSGFSLTTQRLEIAFNADLLDEQVDNLVNAIKTDLLGSVDGDAYNNLGNGSQVSDGGIIQDRVNTVLTDIQAVKDYIALPTFDAFDLAHVDEVNRLLGVVEVSFQDQLTVVNSAIASFDGIRSSINAIDETNYQNYQVDVGGATDLYASHIDWATDNPRYSVGGTYFDLVVPAGTNFEILAPGAFQLNDDFWGIGVNEFDGPDGDCDISQENLQVIINTGACPV